MCATSVLLPQEKRVLINIFHTVILLFNRNCDLCGIYYKKGRGFPIYSKMENTLYSEIENNKKNLNDHDLANRAY